MAEDAIYKAAIYMRLSKDDGDKIASDSITNQREYIKQFLKTQKDICLCSERIDDGYSGVNFDRPGFRSMMEDMKDGKINCIIVKDLSRFGRNYIETGRYLERLFPILGVRFIAINDNYDSAKEANLVDGIMIPFKNLINDEYAKDISIKIRSHLDMKRRKGDFIGAFAAYGYQKSLEDKNKLVIDRFAAQVVKDIYHWKLSGMSAQRIADKLNQLGILSPLEYKEDFGLKYSSGFKTNNQAVWSATTVTRILKNELYTGVLVQGKESSINYKNKKKIKKPENDWIRIEQSHDPIISDTDFQRVQELLLTDTRIAPDREALYLFAGLLQCADCHQNMVRKNVPSGKKNYVYYICSTHKADKSCSSHVISCTCLDYVMSKCLANLIFCQYDSSRLQQTKNRILEEKYFRQQKDYTRLLLKKKEEMSKYYQLLSFLKQDYRDGALTMKQYEDLQDIYRYKYEKAKEAVQVITDLVDSMKSNQLCDEPQFRLELEKYNKEKANYELTPEYNSELTSEYNRELSFVIKRQFVVRFIKKVLVYEKGKVLILLNCSDIFAS